MGKKKTWNSTNKIICKEQEKTGVSEKIHKKRDKVKRILKIEEKKVVEAASAPQGTNNFW